ncbi:MULTISPECIES: hypothetical protein [Vibrio]|uniref:hypothetical protein n=1 Tax=Vibrio TaxID=662 RepID=UPI0003089686|nr:MULTISPECIES: hypothetical protein [Vibrio]AQM20995.1 hypothetical protein PN51_14370 [Vibrio anguillarum]AUB86011.1 hypothetical protein CKY00_01495 [Vibrio anguillarum]AUB89448.1 hypothetical protein CKX99_01490 [Vibrio anguillarum]AUB92889.1 hypothetical protein CK210_01490 [Vibrio anguillarum]AUB96322.1 hypothetical protein CK209_01490 [Vibrio anguillarum]
MTTISPVMSTFLDTDDRASLDSATRRLLDSEVVKRATTGHQSNQIRSLFSSGTKDPLSLIDDILSKYTSDQTLRADQAAKEIEKKANAIAEINRLWGLIMQDNLPNVNPTNNDKTPLGDAASSSYLDQIQAIIANDLNDSRGIAAITGKNLADSKTYRVSYNDLQAMNATMTAFCDTIQVDLDTEQQLFKNIMTDISSAQEEIRDIRRAIVAMAKG